ncbi:hypothetical protein T484DRAFT_1566830, partial [Baffinella frigidus]
GHEAVARMLVEHGADVSVKNGPGDTPLHLAAEHGHDTVWRMMVENGADDSVTNGDEETPAAI